MKSITIAGNIGKDAEVRTIQGSGDKVTGWTVAVEDRTSKEKSTIWFDCTLWGKRGESLAQYLTKGSKVCVSGELSKREHDGKTYLTIKAEQVTLMGGKPDAQRDEPSGQSSGYGAGGRPGGDMDDSIPF
jgi:single-strand DNA-binding protein